MAPQRRLLLAALAVPLAALALRAQEAPRRTPSPLDLSAGPARSDTAWRRASDNGHFTVSIRSVRYPLPVNAIHNWNVQVRDREMRPVTGARVDLDGGMPEHDHGLPTAPESERELGNGSYLVEGVKFSMPGWWRFVVRVRAGDVDDTARFNVVVAPWDDATTGQLLSLSIGSLGDPPADPSNRVADDPRAQELGHRLFFDAGLGGAGRPSCAGCHQPARFFTDGLVRSRGMGRTRRNAPTVVGAAWGSWFYWDGRRDSLWAQALAPFEAAEEMRTTRTDVLRRIAADDDYRARYEALFGTMPGLDDTSRFPPGAGPLGDAAQRKRWEGMAIADRDAVSRAFANVGKSIAAYERLLRPGPSRFDRYVEALLGVRDGDEDGKSAATLSADEEAGLRLMLDDRAPCLRCHAGPLFTNGSFHNIGLPPLGDDADYGRVRALREVLGDPFNCLGPYSDAADGQCRELAFVQRDGETLPGAFKVPTLRNVARTAPYMDAGQFKTLREVLEYYNDPGPPGIGHQEPLPLGLTERQLEQLEAFLRTLDGGIDVDERWLRPPQGASRKP